MSVNHWSKQKKIKQVFLKVDDPTSVETGRAFVSLVNESGSKVFCGNVLSITEDGELIRHAAIDQDSAEKAGIKLDHYGRWVTK